MAAAHAGTVNDWLETAALPVGDILNRRKYSFTVKLYQRPYEWSEPQVKKLARDLELAFQQNKEDYLLLGNVVLFCGSRDLGSTEQRPCDIIDGQQRLTTLLILYAVIQAMLNDAAAATADAADSAAAAAASTGIRQRMVSPDAVSAIIIDSHHRPRLLTNLFPFLDRAGHGGVGRMRERLAVESGKERNTAKTLIKHLSGYADKPQKLLEFLRFLNEHVYLTVTTTRRQHLAFKTFANLNYTGKPLSCLDVLKAIMVQDLPMERGDASAVLGAWNETVHAMATLQSYHEDYEGDAGAGEVINLDA